MAFDTEEKRIKTAQRLQSMVYGQGIKPASLSKATGINRSNISRYLSGQNSPSDKNAIKLAKTLNVSPEWLTGEDDSDSFQMLTSNFFALNDRGKKILVELSETLKDTNTYGNKKID